MISLVYVLRFVFVTFILLLFCFFVNPSPPLQPEILAPTEESFFRVLVTAPAVRALEVFVRYDRREWGCAEDVASAAGKPTESGGGQRLKLRFSASRLDSGSNDLIPFEHHDSRNREACFFGDLKHQVLLPDLLLFG